MPNPNITRLSSYSNRIAMALAMTALWFLSGCSQFNQQPEAKIQEPPFIPAPEATTGPLPEKGVPALFVGAFADLIEYGDQSKHNPRLTEAVSHAIRIGVLKPTGVQDRFNPDNPINYTEFREWATAYQTAAAANGMPLDKSDTGIITPAKAEKKEPRELASKVSRPDALSSPMNPAKLMMLPTQMRWGSHELAPNRPLTREELCGLYVFLAHKTDAAMAMSPDDLESATPGNNSINADEAFGMFKDFQTLSPWAKPYIALAYRDMVLQKVFNLSANHLTIETGFSPNEAITREQAIILLNQVYGFVKNPAPPPPKTPPTETLPGKPINSGMKGKYAPQMEMPGQQPETPAQMTPQTQPGSRPLSRLKMSRESGPSGSRHSMSTQAAE